MSNFICPSCWGLKVIGTAKITEDPYKVLMPDPCTVCKGAGTLPDISLSAHFMFSEMVNSYTAARLGIDNDPSSFIISDLKLVCDTLLEPIRAEFGPIHIDSGYRSEALNKAIGGSTTSAHCYGMAADINVAGTSRKYIMEWIIEHLPTYDQVIFEGTWVHIAHHKNGPATNRKQNLMMFAGKYSPYDPKDSRINT